MRRQQEAGGPKIEFLGMRSLRRAEQIKAINNRLPEGT
jgi:hypothetical protein